MVTDQFVPAATLTCGQCPSAVVASLSALKDALASASPDDDLNVVERAATSRTAISLGWERDHFAGAWLCAGCAPQIASLRSAPCPAWCCDCYGYTFSGEGTMHRRRWATDHDVELAELNQQVDEDGSIAWTIVRIEDIGDLTSREQLDQFRGLLTEITALLDEHNLVLDGGQ